MLADLPPRAFRENALPQCKMDPEIRNGVARWIFAPDQREVFTEAFLGKHLMTLAEHGLTHPRETNRYMTFHALSAMEGEASLKLLRQCLSDDFSPREIRPGHEGEPNGMASFYPEPLEIPHGISNPVVAAMVLALRQDYESLEMVKSLAGKTTDEREQRALADVIAALSEKKTK